MKRTAVIIVGIILLGVVLVGARSFHRGKRPATATEAAMIAPLDDHGADLGVFEKRQGVGWVFGRLIGVSQAPGNPNNSPFSYSHTWAGDNIRPTQLAGHRKP